MEFSSIKCSNILFGKNHFRTGGLFLLEKGHEDKSHKQSYEIQCNDGILSFLFKKMTKCTSSEEYKWKRVVVVVTVVVIVVVIVVVVIIVVVIVVGPFLQPNMSFLNSS